MWSARKSIKNTSMSHPFPIKDIARQSGLSTATVDRVLNERANVSPRSRARVSAAIAELEGQEQQLSARGRRLHFDVLVEAPERFSREIRHAIEAVLPTIGPAVIHARYSFRQIMSAPDCVALLRQIVKRGSHGVVLKVRDLPEITAMVAELDSRGIPVVCAFTDLPRSARRAYCGPDNYAAGQSAAYMIDKCLPGSPSPGATILTTLSQLAFHGEAQRRRGFLRLMSNRRPDLRLMTVEAGAGLALETRALLQEKLSAPDIGPILGVYSMGGANRAILELLKSHGQVPRAYIAHDLDSENRTLLRQGNITVALQHDIASDMRNAFLSLLYANQILKAPPVATQSRISMVTPFDCAEN
ncbi:LacI family transcriptional regulator [Phaeobacter inhibens]|nr:transcriptional regulator, IclR family [Phaeobacter inhibens DSM 17395]AXT21970.1 LacI family transcriptional regulator [Phaeobacter inhibens]